MGTTPSEFSWPALAIVIADARRDGLDAVADALVKAVTAGSTSGEILGGVGQVLRIHRGVRARLLPSAQVEWDAVLAEVHRAYPGSAVRDWLAGLPAKLR